MADEFPIQSDLTEFGDPNSNATDVTQVGDVIQPDPEADFTDELPYVGLE